MFNKILIANRGEIACRIIETAKLMGVQTVAVYSDADASAKHVELADEAYHIGPPSVAESYLQSARIIDVAKRSGAQAIHPGYGFLSENPDFVEAVEKAGLRFIGPSVKAIRAMGLKDAAKTLMQEAGVPVVPGYHGENQDAGFLASEADKIGYPVLIKARAGGGGKGMRKVDHPDQFAEALEGAQREGQASFGDAACLIEKWITTPRHIEIQVFGDDHGNAVHLFERDCSLQRRHQKVIEEAPAPGMTSEMRQAMGDAAVRCAQSIGYSGAGTVEFIVDASDGLHPDRFWFMEMNTRLQVEHPVTELITGFDLVEWQLRVASGEAIPASQDDLQIHGHAFEARIYAEDVPAGFLPSTGKLHHLYFPDDARSDSGVRGGDTISPWYDPMIAKLIVHGPTREIALNRLDQAICQSRITGLKTNLAFLSALCRNDSFKDGSPDTGLIERDLDQLVSVPVMSVSTACIAAIIASDVDLFDQFAGWSIWQPLKWNTSLTHNDEVQEFTISIIGAGLVSVSIEDEMHEIVVREVSLNRFDFGFDGKLQHLDFVVNENVVTIFDGATANEFEIFEVGANQTDGEDSPDQIISPMPGEVKLISAVVGEKVKKGKTLAIVEAMKMEHSLTAARDGVIEAVFVLVGDQVEAGAHLLALEPEDE